MKTRTTTSTKTRASATSRLDRLSQLPLRLGKLKNEAALHGAIVTEAARLLGAQRVLLVLHHGTAAPHVAASKLPPSESVEALLQAIAPWLTDARDTGASRLRHGPEGVDPQHQRSCLVAPLVAPHGPLGCLYADIDGADVLGGRFEDAERGLLAMLAAQAAVALAHRAELAAVARGAQASADDVAVARAAQTATAEVLQVISSSVADTAPVFEKILQSCERLVACTDLSLLTLDDDSLVHLSAVRGAMGLKAAEDYVPQPVERTIIWEALQLRRVMHYPDALNGADVPKPVRRMADVIGNYAVVVAPMLLQGRAVGAFFIVRTFAERQWAPFTDREIALVESFADQAVIAIQNARLFNETKEALEQQTATSDILRVISSSPTTLDPVLEAVVKTAARLCDATNASLYRVEGDLMRKVAGHGSVPTAIEVGDTRPVTGGTLSGRAMLERRTLHIPDLLAEADTQDPVSRDYVRREGIRTFVATPLLREGVPIGAITVYRTEVRLFSDKQIGLLQTFADQAVIAIENVRLFNETKEALEQQTATSEVLQVISKSVSDTAPVFVRILESCSRLLSIEDAAIYLASDDGMLLPGASHGTFYKPSFDTLPRPLGETVSGLAIRERRTIHYPDVLGGADVPAVVRDNATSIGDCSIAFAPLLWNERGIGALSVLRVPKRPFTDKELGLLASFADQAVIAIQNARLFNQTQEALERQTATAEILKVIAGSPSDVQPVFNTIAASARRLLDGGAALVVRRAGDKLELAAFTSSGEAADAALRALFPVPITGTGHMGQAILNAAPVLISDVENDPNYSEAFRANARLRGVRSIVTVPMLLDGEPIGGISVNRPVAGKFSEHQTSLLQTFADPVPASKFPDWIVIVLAWQIIHS